MQERYIKNLKNLINEEQQNNLLTKHIGVIGCGGNGGYVIEFLARLGINELSLWDGDCFEESNLNRQIYCNELTLNKNKATIADYYVKKINKNILVNVYNNFFGENELDFDRAIKCDLIILCADHGYNWVKQRATIRDLIVFGKPIIEEAIHEDGAFVKILTKEDIEEFDKHTKIQTRYIGDECLISQPAYLCAIAAAFSVSEMVKYFNQEKNPAIGQCIELDINTMKIHRYDFEYGQLY